MAQKLTKNIGLKILAVLIATVLWLVATNINDPVSRQTYSVPVVLENLDKLTNNNKYVEVLDNTDTVRVTVRAARSVLAEISERNLIAVADVEKMTEGNYIPISLSCTKNGIDGDNLVGDKEYVKVNVENIRRRQLPISVNVIGELEENYMLGGSSTAQNAVMLSGPESLVNTVNTVSVEIDIAGATSDVNISLPIHMYNADGEEITDTRIDKSISDVSTTAVIWLIKNVPLEYEYKGEPAEGYHVDGNLKSTQNYIAIAGKPSVVKNTQKITVKEALDISGATYTVEEEIDLRKHLPEGLVFADPEEDTKTTLSVSVVKNVEDEEEEEEQEE